MKCIFHTGQAGSTLLVTLLGTSNRETYSEPGWTHELVKQNVFPRSYADFENDFPDAIVKVPSGICCTAPLSSRPKIFLYRKYRDHIYRIFVRMGPSDGWKDAAYFFKYEKTHSHPLLTGMSDFQTDMKKLSFMWANNLLWLQDSKDVLWIDTNCFCKDLEKTTKKVCEFLGIPPVQDFSWSRWDVKAGGLLGRNEPLYQIDLHPPKLIRRNPENGAVHPVFRDSYQGVKDLTDWFISELPPKAYERLKEFI